MAGFKPSEPRDKSGRWTGDGGWPTLDTPKMRSTVDFPQVKKSSRPSPNYSQPRGQKTLYQHHEGGTRLNRKLPQAPSGLRKPSTGEYRTINKTASAHQARMMAAQRDARSSRDTLVDNIMRHPGGVHFVQLNDNPARLMPQPLAGRAMRVASKIEGALSSTEKFLNKWWK